MHTNEQNDSPAGSDGVRAVVFGTDGERLRTVITRASTRRKVKYASFKMKRMLHADSVDEAQAFAVLDADPTVHAFYEQRGKIIYALGGALFAHYPDILIEYSDRKEFWEIKKDHEAELPDVRERTRVLQATLPNFGFGYRIVVKSEVAAEPRQSNIRHLLRWGRLPSTLVDRNRVREFWKAAGGAVPWGSIKAGWFGPGARQLVCSLILEGRLCVDLNQPITDSTLVYQRAGG